MFQHILPAGNDPGALGILVMVIAPAVLLLGWLYNAYRMGRFRQKVLVDGRLPRKPRSAFALCILLLGILAFLVSWLLD